MGSVYKNKGSRSSLFSQKQGVDRIISKCYAVSNHRMTRNALPPSIAKEIAAMG